MPGRQKGVKCMGRPRISDVKKNLILRLYGEDNLTVKQIAEACGVSRASVFRILKEKERSAADEQTQTDV